MADETSLTADGKRIGRPSKARGAPLSSDAAEDRWTVRGVKLRRAAVSAAAARGMPVGDWLDEAIHAYLDRGAPTGTALAVVAPVDEKLEDLRRRIEMLETGWLKRLVNRVAGMTVQ